MAMRRTCILLSLCATVSCCFLSKCDQEKQNLVEKLNVSLNLILNKYEKVEYFIK